VPDASRNPDEFSRPRDEERRRARGLAVCNNPEIMSGTPVFAGSRVPVQTLLEYLERGQTLGQFVADFPTVTQERAIAAMGDVKEALFVRARRSAESAMTCWIPGSKRIRDSRVVWNHGSN
jgi:uncharacterized protein (DUF433 family)